MWIDVDIVEVVDLTILGYFVAVNTFYTLLIIAGLLEIAQRKRTRLVELDEAVLAETGTPPVSVLVPSFNEETHVVQSVRAFLGLRYPDHRVIVINDGSSDATLQRLQEEYDLLPLDLVVRRQLETRPVRGIYQSRLDERLIVIDKENGGKADALNVGLNVARTPLVCCVDADTIVERDALLRMVEPFFYQQEGVVAVGGTVRVANGCTIENGHITAVDLPESWLARFQLVEYLRAFLFGRMGFNKLGGQLIISGAFGLFYRDAVMSVGGYDERTVGEDMELVVKLQRYSHTQARSCDVIHIPEPICYTEVPEDLVTLGRQRSRWQRGLAESLWRHKRLFLNPRYGWIGSAVFPLFVLFELLGPLIELGGYIWFLVAVIFGFVSWPFAVLFVVVSLVWGTLLSLMSLLFDWWSFDVLGRGGRRVRGGLVLTALLENLGYRQLTLFFRLRGTLGFLLGERRWGRMRRMGFKRRGDDEDPEPEPQPAAQRA